ncbi:hypothetical protein MYCTH_2307943 [Thermothelomyces thermophilus ATCC 42464]|uniref:DUF7708 domain-containing protein n=1 Tax=Thermothelomyces thermophilus (strain ATCC 42464 / BCRC 31852 / DSM 1799) TaxID=573729 RepID=G2QIS4_THET4|nr:uncharacterized protein MYCTH_2307943 [Thermothelomyces thermophilus ATCC 42464]AEO59552.1 hypothetical protein MYCTH_2307943 [Thermothelomyces thermophilus ATCC 42464]
MDPETFAPGNPPGPNETTSQPAGGQLIIPSQYDAVSEQTSAGLVNQLLVRPHLLDVAVAVRRFSSPSIQSGQQRLTENMEAARTAYAKAVVAIQKSVKDMDAVTILTRTSEHDVAQTAIELFNSPSGEDNKGRVSQFIDILHHYSGVFDVLSQAGDFAYLAVVWGGIKMLLLMAKNKKELLTRVTDMLVEIGLSLSRIEVYAKLFPTARMVELVSMIYAAVAEFLEDVILHFARKSALRLRVLLSAFVRPFDEKFGRAVDRIRRLETCIEKDALLLHALRTTSMAQHHLGAYLQRAHLTTALDAHAQPHPLEEPAPSSSSSSSSVPAPAPPVPALLEEVKRALFRGLRDQATYHESLAATYRVTASAWEEWFAVEQRHLPSSSSTSSTTTTTTTTGGAARLSQGLCDAPDHQHALQWLAQQRRLTPELPSCYLVWAPGMTAQAAVASLVLQVLLQRPGAVVELGLDRPGVFDRARDSIAALWGLFTYLMRAMGGGLVYMSIGSAGEEEFAIVDRFVRTVRAWDGPPIWVTIIHPHNGGFVGIDRATDLDGLYDVHPSLTTTDALHHVLMLELDIHHVSDTIQTVLWEAAWRETRYASVGISFSRVVAVMEDLARELATRKTDVDNDGGGGADPVLTDAAREQWMEGVRRWLSHPGASNCTRELVQRHLDVVPLAFPDDVRAEVGRHLKRLVLRIDDDESKTKSFASRSMTEAQRHRVWDHMRAAIVPGSEAMFCAHIRDLMSEALQVFAEMPCHTPKQATYVVARLLNGRFGADGVWKSTMPTDAQLMVHGIKEAVKTGFARTIEALSEPEGAHEVAG